jgi:outer membrane protein TolC
MHDRLKTGKRPGCAKLRRGVSLVLLATLATFAGCTRQFFRERADAEVSNILAEKEKHLPWKLDNFHVYPDKRARFADPTDPDKPPMPPDDPAAHDLAPNPQRPGKAGVARVEGTGYLDLLRMWNAQNRGQDVQQACSTEAPSQPFLLKLEQAVELGLINSREYQTRREDLYLTALPVTLERFAFAAQWFGLITAIRERAGSDSVVGQQNNWSLSSTAGFTKLFSTGALLLFQFANDTVINLTGPGRNTTSISTINLDFVQPLLRGGGKAVTLEPLTQVERNLVYEIRDYARFRKEFFVSIAGGGDLPSLGGAAGRLGGGITPGAVSIAVAARPQLTPGSAGRLDLALTGLAIPEGYLPTLLRAAVLVNEEKNVALLQKFLPLFVEYEKGGRIEPLQVDQVRGQLLQAQSTVLQRGLDLRDSLDRFKLQLGLPVNLPLELDQTPTKPLQDHLQEIESVFSDFTTSVEALKKLSGFEQVGQIRANLRRFLVETPTVRGTPFQKEFLSRWDAWAPTKVSDDALARQLALLREERKNLTERKEAGDPVKPFTPAEEERLRRLDQQIEAAYLEQAVRAYERRPWETTVPSAEVVVTAGTLGAAFSGTPPGATLAAWGLPAQAWGPQVEFVRRELDRRRRTLAADLFQQLSGAVELVLGEARAQQFAPLRERWPGLPPVEVDGIDLLTADLEQAQEVVVTAALTNRLDLMNARAQVVDTWRQLKVFANSLLGTFDVAYHLDSVTPSGEAKPLAFTGSRTRHQLIFNAELPLVRKAERNNYRASLIAYQRQRRNLQAIEDLIAATVRQEIRQLRVQAENYKIQQKAVELQYLQVESSLERFNAPPDPQARGPDSTQAAALTTQLLNAQSRLPNVQNQLVTVWINYYLTRLQLYLDLERMPVDSRGVWIDELAARQRDSQPGRNGGPGDGQRQRRGPEVIPPPQPGAPAAAAKVE